VAQPLLEKDKHSLIKLFSDEDPSVIRLLEESFRSQGASGIAFLKQLVSEAPLPARENAERVLFTLQEDRANQAFSEFSLYGTDLETGLFLLAQTRYPDLDAEPYKNRIQGMSQDLRSRTLPEKPRQAVQAVNHYLYTELGFQGNTGDYYDPENSFINRVLDKKTGIPITLSAVYLAVTKPLGLPLAGVGMPGHFILKWNPGNVEDTFFVDPFHKGRILNQNDCVAFLIQSGYGFSPGYLEPVNSRRILSRMCNNLASIYRHRDETERAERYARFALDLSL
jgi:regulator of sirC expression with transglutaminase-like and TPR domain